MKQTLPFFLFTAGETKRMLRLGSMTQFAAILLLFGVLVLCPAGTHAQFAQQGNKLVGTGGVNGTFGSHQGVSVALSSDGNTAIVGGYTDNSSTGAAWVYTRTGGVWSQQGSKLVGTGAVGYAQQGFSVSLSPDGNTAIVGGQADNSRTGAAWVYRRGASGVRELAEEVPVQFGLSQNYPNPFNPTATIRYEIPSGANVSLRVYNLLGQKVAELVDETQQRGRYTVQVDAANLASGVYYYRLEAGKGSCRS